MLVLFLGVALSVASFLMFLRVAYPTEDFVDARRSGLPLSVLVVGLVLTGLAGVYTLSRLRRQVRIEELVTKRTLELSREIVECHRAEEVLQTTLEESRRRQEEVSALLQASRAMMEHREYKDVARQIFDSCKGLIGATAGYVALLSHDATENEVLFLDSGGLPCAVDPVLPMPIRGLRGGVYRTGEAAYENDFSNSEWAKYLPEGHSHLENVLFAPLIVEGRTIGLLGIANKPGGFTKNDARLAMAFGEMAAIALRNSRAFDMLKDSEERLRSVVETATDAIITSDSNGNIVSWNRGAKAILGYKAEEIVGEPLTRIVPGELRERHQEALERAVRDGRLASSGKPLQALALKKDGMRFPAEISIGTWKVGEAAFFAAIVRDGTERERAEERIRELAKFPDENPGPVLRVAGDGTILYANRSTQPLLDTWGCRVGQQLPPHLCELTSGALASGTNVETEALCGNRTFSLLLTSVPDEGYINIYGRDITDRKQAEEAVRQVQGRLAARVRELDVRTREMALLSEMGDMLQSCAAVEESYAVVARFARGLFPWASGALHIITASRNLAEAKAVWGESPPQQRVFEPDKCWALRRGRMYLVKNTRVEVPCQHMESGLQKPLGYVCVPLSAHGEILGSLHLRYPLDSGSPQDIPGEAQIQLATAVADHLALALANLKLRETLRQQATRDPLTGLLNRRYMEEALERDTHQARRNGSKLAVIMLDIDHFKRVNDTYGHEAGDAMLHQLGDLLQVRVRGGDVACRYGGEEFVLILPGAPLEHARQRAEELRRDAQLLRVKRGDEFIGPITISLGVAVFPDDGATRDAVLEAADAAMYRAKQRGRNRVETA